jgi:DNA-damage-inducible protein J
MTLLSANVKARIDLDTKIRAADTLNAMGLSISDAIRLLMLRIANDKCLPFEIKAPNAVTKKAIEELESKQGKSFDNLTSLMANLNEEN